MILVVDDDKENRESLAAALRREGWPCFEAADGHEALKLLREKPELRLLLTDMRMPGGLNGLELLQMARHLRPDVQRLLITAYGTIEDTVEAMRAGAFDVLTKPVRLKPLRDAVSRLLERAPDARLAPAGSQQISAEYARVTETLRRAAQAEASILFRGESGSGKSFLAHLLHEHSPRREGPFVTLNCAAIPEDLLESELFGYEKGAFTGATQSREGKVAAANGGTLLLDEIGDLGLSLQAKLLQLIQERRFFKLGSNRETRVDVRIVSATNQDLNDAVAQGRFREDLYYRLKVIEIQVPSLRERKQDLLWLIPSLLDSLTEKNRMAPVRLSQRALARLWSHEWRGNIRELENVLERSLVLAPPEDLRDGLLDEKHLPEELRSSADRATTLPPMTDLATIERQAIQQALAICGGNRRLAAHMLGISERTLYRVLGAEGREAAPDTTQ
jgi:two-component system response regulator HydG